MDGRITEITIMSIASLMLCSCASMPYDRYNTQKGAAIGAGVGAIGGQLVGRNTEGTLIGAAVGMLLGSIIGNAADQSYQAEREAVRTNKRVVSYDDHGGAVEVIPGPRNQHTDCRKVAKRLWRNGALVSETVERLCEEEKYTYND
jgi:uncharacterized protein YcfJ